MLLTALLPSGAPHTSTLYQEWVRRYSPGLLPEAEAAMAEVSAGLVRADAKPGRFMDSAKYRAGRLPAAHRPWFFDTVGHLLLDCRPGHAGRAYRLAREAESAQGLRVDRDFRIANTALFGSWGALSGTQLNGHQRWLVQHLDAVDAYRELAGLLRVWGRGAAPSADLHRRLRATGRLAGIGPEEDARVLAELLSTCQGAEVPDALLDGAAELFAEFPPDAAPVADLAELFPTGVTDGAAWLRLLEASGVAAAMADGRITLKGGPAGWIGSFARNYSMRRKSGGVSHQAMPEELFALIPRLAAEARRVGGKAVLHRNRFRHTVFDVELIDACLAAGIPVHDPGPIRLRWPNRPTHRRLRAMPADPVFGPRLEGTPFAAQRQPEAAPRLRAEPGISTRAVQRVEAGLTALRGGGPEAAELALTALDGLLNVAQVRALPDLEAELAALDLSGPLARALRAGVPEELAWPAYEAAHAELAAGPGPVRATSSWPVLVLFNAERAIAVDHRERRGSCRFEVPANRTDEEGTEFRTRHSVHFSGGRFLVSWQVERVEAKYGSRRLVGTDHWACWADRPERVFKAVNWLGLRPLNEETGYVPGYQFEVPEGRLDGSGVLRPGQDDPGIDWFFLQLSDGDRYWSSQTSANGRSHRRDQDGWQRVDTASGERSGVFGLPDFFSDEALPAGMGWVWEQLSLAPLPAGVRSPLGQVGELTGCRVMRAGTPTRYLLEGNDGRRAEVLGDVVPWGVLRMPGGGVEGVLTTRNLDETVLIDPVDQSALWQVPSAAGRRPRRPAPARPPEAVTDADSVPGRPVLPPPAFWHFLTARDESASSALRDGADTLAPVLLRAAAEGGCRAVRTELAGLLKVPVPERIADGVARVAAECVTALRYRERLSERVLMVRRAQRAVKIPSGPADAELLPALGGLLPKPGSTAKKKAEARSAVPSTVTAVAAHGAVLRGAIGSAEYRLAPPGRAVDHSGLFGRIDAVAWRAVSEATPPAHREALAGLLRIWAAQPFALPGRWRIGTASGAALAALPDDSGTVTVGMAEGSEQVPHPREPLADDNSYRFVQPESAELPDGAEVTRTAVVTRDDAARLSALLELAERHGPLPLPRAAVAEFVRITGTDRPTAVFALAGLPEFDEGEQPLRAKPFGARTVAAAGELRALGARLGVEGRQRLSEAALPNELSELWAPDGMLAAARRMAGAWLELVGVPEAPDEQEELLLAVTADLDREFKFHGDWPEFLLGRRAEVPGGPPEALRLRIDRYGGPRLFRGDRVMYSTGPGDRFGLSVLVWLLTECPVGHPAAVRAAELYAELCERRGTAGLLLDLGNHPVPEGIDRAAQFGPGTAPVPAGPEPFWREGIEQPEVYDNGLLLVPSTKGRWHLHVRAAGLTDPALVAATLGRLDGLGMTEPAVLVRQLDVLLGSGPPRMLERAARTPVPVGGYELNPALSVPELTAEAAGVLEVEPDAAALYLQLLALARPTDRNVRTWNGWTPARLRAAQTELAELGLVVRDKRPRAGRTVFLPGPWTELKAPDLPLEARKVGTHLAVVNDRNEASGPFQRLLPPRPPHELFAAAWAAR